jgi:hypothetical protein
MTCCGVVKAMRLWVRIVTGHFGLGHPLCALLFNLIVLILDLGFERDAGTQVKIQVRAEETA